ncbi:MULTISPECIES: aldo/keto reductase [Sporosarcina]|uniref:aldo/keto reductase n=1 Tax=Sporosarcina TaxID=1569 RepID=UPI00058C1840|nr:MULTISPECIES: aldo/keto reductase [Sporosarcina]WJY28640.1 aldo/keto reductase [Sporosarcina sp. 0.2-SM1T-5]
MDKRELGNSGLYVSELGLGCMSLPSGQSDADRIVAAAIDAGITLIDTADLYDGGANEELVGRALKGRRQDIILATKVGNQIDPDGKGWTWNPSKKHILEGAKASLKRLGTDYIDLYQLHGGTMEDDYEETIEAFEQLRKEGLIRQYGISSIRPNVIERFLSHSSAISVMMQYSMLDRRPEEWFNAVSDQGASVIARGPLAKGLLTAEGQGRAERAGAFAAFGQPELTDTVRRLTAESSDLHAAAIRFCLSDSTVACALAGARTEEQLTDTLNAYRSAVSDEEIGNLVTLLPKHVYDQHRI